MDCLVFVVVVVVKFVNEKRILTHLRVSQGEIHRIDVEVYRGKVGRGCEIRIRYRSAGHYAGEDFFVWGEVGPISCDVDGELQSFF